MSQAEELLNSISEGIPVHDHPVPDTDTYFVIDPITRKIENTNRKKSVVMQYDHNSERFTFELPRYIDGHDMLECTSVIVNVDNIEASEEVEPRINSDAPSMTDLQTHPNDPDKVISSWLISRNSTQLAGILSFSIEYKCVDSNGNVAYEWSTDIYDEIEVRARKKNGEASVMEYTDVLEQWRTRIFGAGDSVIANIAAEGEAQVAAVKAESETQQEAVELKGAQTLDSIPEDYTEVDAMADEAVRSKGDAIVCEAAGESIVVKDSSNDHIRGFKLFGKSGQRTTTGKNLFNYTKSHFPKVLSGVTFTYDDGWVILNGTCTDSTNMKMGTTELTAGSYTISANNPVHNNITQALVQVYNYTDTKGLAATDNKNDSYSVGVLTDGAYECRIRIEAGITYANFKVKPQLEVGTVATEHENYTGGKPAPNPDYPQEIVSVANPTVRVYGKNLIPYPYPFSSPKTAAGVTFTVNEDGGISMSGTPTAYTGVQLCNKLVWNSDMAIALLGTYTNAVMDVNVFDVDGSSLAGYVSVKELILYKADFPRDFGVSIAIKRNVNDIEMTGTAYPIVIAGDILPTEYEPYKVPQALAVPNTIPGIPVASGGNYTDSDGQQWICDEVDLERGVYMQRIITHVFDGSSDEHWTNGYVSNGVSNRFEIGVPDLGYIPCSANVPGVKRAFCNSFRFSITDLGIPPTNMFRAAIDSITSAVYLLFNPDTNIIPLEDVAAWRTYMAENPIVCYLPINTPIETPLTAEEITAFKALKTNYPNTTILNDAGAWMSVKYNADTKTYVENPKTLKLVDSSTGVVYELKVVDGVLTVIPV